MRIGVIGTGIMASYMVMAFCDWECEHEFVLSPRNKEKAEYLASKYKNVSVANNNQDVLDNSEVVILSVLPQNAEEILSGLKFQERHKVISVIAAIGLKKLRDIIGPTEILVDVLPLPFISKRIGPLVIHPSCAEVEELLGPLGELVILETEEEMNVVRCITALMSPYYELVNSIVEWSQNNGMSEPAAKAYATSFFGALSVIAAGTEKGKLKELAEEMTPGGLNWQAVTQLQNHHAFELWQDAMDKILDRVTGK